MVVDAVTAHASSTRALHLLRLLLPQRRRRRVCTTLAPPAGRAAVSSPLPGAVGVSIRQEAQPSAAPLN
jgi:hypothetical protein